MMPYLLVVDDQAWMNLLFSLILERCGYKVRTMQDGKEALSSIQSRFPDLVLLDIVMPDFSGVDVLESMADDPDTASIPVLVVSAVDEEFVPIEHIRRKMHIDFLVKPFKADQLAGKVKRCLETVYGGKFDYAGHFQSVGSMARVGVDTHMSPNSYVGMGIAHSTSKMKKTPLANELLSSSNNRCLCPGTDL